MKIPDYQYLYYYKFDDLVVKYGVFEKQLQANLTLLIKTYFEKNASAKNTTTYFIGGKRIQLLVPKENIPRKYTLALVSLDMIVDSERVRRVEKVSEIGKISEIEILYSKDFPEYYIDSVATLTKQYIREAYLTFEKIFLDKYGAYKSSIIKSVSDTIATALETRHKTSLATSFWLTYTYLLNTKRDGNFRFDLDAGQLSQLLRKLKDRENTIFSPIEIVLTLLFDYIPDNGLEYFAQNQREVRFDLGKMGDAISSYTAHYFGESAMYGEKNFGFKYIAQHNNHLLAISYAERHSQELLAVIDEIEEEIDFVFKDLVSKIKSKIGHQKPQSIFNTEVYQAVRDIFVGIVSDIGVKLIKPD
ncbi:hypothetical protein [Dyadobacter sp. CY323]|uniref:hypothetical protein n=1 Tax=Dyadobacter sp. CY323 TaxID=2907302 RepID=UPI001F363EFE|nr:hypothetical protein [Dyadobacter sp. CY323]MCE6989548.1 hypothetical protein [Dyadobacter sp. CY323]